MPSDGVETLDRMLDEFNERFGGSKSGGTDAAIDTNARRARERWDAFAALIASGHTVVQACDEIGVTRGAYEKRRSRYPRFATRIDMIRARRNEGLKEKWDGSSVDFATRFIPPPEDSGIDWPYEDYDYSFYQHAITRELDRAEPGEIVLILLPPGGRKTTTVENWIIQQYATDKNVRIGYGSKSQAHSRKSVGRIKNILADDPTLAPDLIARFGPFKESGRTGKPWAADYFTIATKTSSTRDYSFSAFGGGTQVYGSRFDKIILDDFQTNQNLSQTDDLLHQFQFEILSRRPRGGKGVVVIIGTRIGPGDFYEKLIEEYGTYDWFKVVKLPVRGSDGASLDPECFPDESLEQLRAQLGEKVWSASYMQAPVQTQNPTFTDDMMDTAKRLDIAVGWTAVKERDGERVATPMERPQTDSIVTGLDPNLGAGYTAVLTAAFNADELRVLDLEKQYGHSQTEQNLSLLEKHLKLYGPDDVVVEINNYQRGLHNDEPFQELKRKYGFSSHPHTTHRNKADVDIGVARMPSSFIRGEVALPWGTDAAASKSELLIGELLAWRPGVKGAVLEQDFVMVLWFCWLLWQRRRPTEDFDASKWHTSGVVYRDQNLAGSTRGRG